MVVYTEDDDSHGGQKAGGPPYKVEATLTLEISVVVPAKVNDEFVAGVPATDVRR